MENIISGAALIIIVIIIATPSCYRERKDCSMAITPLLYAVGVALAAIIFLSALGL